MIKRCLFTLVFYSISVSVGLSFDYMSFHDYNTQLLKVKPFIEEYWRVSNSITVSDTHSSENPTLSPTPQKNKMSQVRFENRQTFKWHRYIGYSVLVGSISSAIVGNMVLEKYRDNERPPTWLLYTHRGLGITTGLLGISNGYLGSINYKKLKGEKVGLKKRKTHRILSTIATTGFLATTVLGILTMLDYRNADNPKDVEIVNIHRAVALTTAGVTLATVIVIMW